MNLMPIVPDDSLFLPAFLAAGDDASSPLLPPGGGDRDGDLDLDGGASLPGFHMVAAWWAEVRTLLSNFGWMISDGW